ncbi:MAG: hypothetical protein IPK26_30945 [Planctomycetes bacterium]|nr:hypothetical protein [Planctomycetota bacterium]
MTDLPDHLQRIADEIDGWLELRCPERAFERLDTLLAHPIGRTEGLALRVRALVAQARHDEALHDLAELRKTAFDPEWVDLVDAWCKKRTQDLPGAVACMERVVERNPESAIGHFNLACYAALAGDGERALAEIGVACRIDQTLREFAAHERDLHTLHDDPRFQAILEPPPAD